MERSFYLTSNHDSTQSSLIKDLRDVKKVRFASLSLFCLFPIIPRVVIETSGGSWVRMANILHVRDPGYTVTQYSERRVARLSWRSPPRSLVKQKLFSNLRNLTEPNFYAKSKWRWLQLSASYQQYTFENIFLLAGTLDQFQRKKLENKRSPNT